MSTPIPTPVALLLLAYGDVSGRSRVNSTTLRYGLAGAALVDLAAAGRIDVIDGKVAVRDPTPTRTPYLDAALQRIATERRQRRPHWWVEKLSRRVQQQVLDDLVARGWLRREERKVLGVFPADRYPGVITGPEDELRTRVRAVVLDGAPAGADLAPLIAVMRACGMEKLLVPDVDRDTLRAVKSRMKEISEGDWAGAAVKRAIDELYAAVVAAVTASTAATVASSG